MNVGKHRIAFATSIAKELDLKVKLADIQEAKLMSGLSGIMLHFDGYQSYTIVHYYIQEPPATHLPPDRYAPKPFAANVTITATISYSNPREARKEIITAYHKIRKIVDELPTQLKGEDHGENKDNHSNGS